MRGLSTQRLRHVIVSIEARRLCEVLSTSEESLRISHMIQTPAWRTSTCA